MANILSQELSVKQIDAFKRPDKPVTIRDGNGLVLRLSPTKTESWRSWYFVYTSPETGKRVYKPLGCYPDVSLSDARKEATMLRATLLTNVDPVEAARRKVEARQREEEEQRRLKELEEKTLTIAGLIDEYLTKHAKVHKRNWKEDERILKKDALRAWGKRKAADIKKRDVTLLLESILDRGAPAASNQFLKVVRKMFNFAVERDIMQASPCVGVKALAPNVRRDRVLTESEIKTLWFALETSSMSDESKRALKLILLTGQRPGEVAGIHVNELDGRWWTLPSERSKNGKEHRVYLTDTALSLIGDTNDKGYVFPCPHEAKQQSIDTHSLAVAVRRNLAWPVTVKGNPVFLKDGKAVTDNRLGINHFTPHDLRRTAATKLSELGFMDEVIDAVLNHTKQGIIRTYNLNRYDREKQQALESWERKLLSILSDTQSKVIPITRKRAA